MSFKAQRTHAPPAARKGTTASTHGGGSIDYAGQTFNGNQIVNQLAPNRFSNPQKAYYNYVKS